MICFRDRKTSITGTRPRRCCTVNTSSRLMREGGALGELVIDHIANEGGCGFEAQFVEYATFVGADRLGAQVQVGSGLAGAPAGGKRQQDLVFLGREICGERDGKME